MRLTLGVDVGQASDPTAIVGALTEYEEERPHPPHQKSPRRELLHRVVFIKRLPLGTPYPEVVDVVAKVGAEGVLAYSAPVSLWVDQTGVGRPVIDMLRRATSLSLHGVTITGGDAASDVNAHEHRVPKRDLLGRLEVTMQTERVKVSPGCMLADDLCNELGHFQYEISSRGHDSYEAASGHHDDLVIAAALAIFGAESPGQGAVWMEWGRRKIADAGRGPIQPRGQRFRPPDLFR